MEDSVKPWDLDSLLECVHDDLHPEQIRALILEAYEAGGRPVSPLDPDYGACVCGARRGESHTDHTNVVAYTFITDEHGRRLTSIKQGGTGKVLWRDDEDNPA